MNNQVIHRLSTLAQNQEIGHIGFSGDEKHGYKEGGKLSLQLCFCLTQVPCSLISS